MSSTVLVRVPNSTGGTKVISVGCGSTSTVWQLKVQIYSLTMVPPTKQSIYLANDGKELDNTMRLRDLFKNLEEEKPLVIMKRAPEDKRKISRRRDKRGIRGKKFREMVKPEYCYAGGRGISKAVLGIPSPIILQAISKEFQVIVAKDGRMFECEIYSEDNPDQPHSISFKVLEKEQKVKAEWIPEQTGNYYVTVKVMTNDGPQNISGSPFMVTVIDHEKNGNIVKKLIYDKDWNVEAAQIIVDWANKEEMHKVILADIGMTSILDLLTMEPQALIQPLMSLALTRLIQTDSTKRLIIEKGGISGLTALLTLDSHAPTPTISRFVSRSFATIGELTSTFLGTSIQEDTRCRQVFSLCNAQFFNILSSLLDNEDLETRKNCSRALSVFSRQRHYLSLMANADIYPKIVELYENTDNDVSIRRYALSTLANFTTETQYCKKFYTDARIHIITKALSHPFTEDLLVSDAVRALANLSLTEDFADTILRNHSGAVETILNHTGDTDSLTAWEVGICVDLLPENVDKASFQNDYVNAYHRDDRFNFESIRLLANLLGNANQPEILISKLVGTSVIPSIVRFIKSLNLGLQYVACKAIASLSAYDDCRKEIINTGGLSALCSALNTCTKKATAHIVASLAQMPLDIKGVLLNIIGDSGIAKLVNLLKQSGDVTLQKHTAILLASLAGSEENRKIVNLGGAAFLKNLMDLVHKGTVNVETHISPDEITCDNIIGRGISGVVWKATYKSKPVAVKKFDEDSLAFSIEEFKNEAALMSILRHENIVHCIGSCAEPENLYIVSEIFEKGCLSNLIEDKTMKISTPLVLHMALGAASGMKYLHTLGIIHRDLKNGNLLVSDDLTVKVADFGLSRMTDNKMTRGVGTPIYTAPEVLAGNDYSQKADVYSFAYVLWELITREIPFKDLPPFDAVRKACDEDLRPNIPENCIFEGLITSCWQKNPDSRPSFTEIVEVLSRLRLLVGAPSEVSGIRSSFSMEEDLEDQQYNYSEAKEIFFQTIRTRKMNESDKKYLKRVRSSKDEGKRITRESSGEKPRKKRKKADSTPITEKKKPRTKTRKLEQQQLITSNPDISPLSQRAVKSNPEGQKLSSTQPITLMRCELCSKPIIGRSIKVENSVWHISCFACTHCKKSLLSQAWCKHEDKPYCKEDYQNLFSMRCARCNSILNDKYLNALDRNWHPGCFVCHKCETVLGAFEEVNGEPTCPSCAANELQ